MREPKAGVVMRTAPPKPQGRRSLRVNPSGRFSCAQQYKTNRLTQRLHRQTTSGTRLQAALPRTRGADAAKRDPPSPNTPPEVVGFRSLASIRLEGLHPFRHCDAQKPQARLQLMPYGVRQREPARALARVRLGRNRQRALERAERLRQAVEMFAQDVRHPLLA